MPFFISSLSFGKVETCTILNMDSSQRTNVIKKMVRSLKNPSWCYHVNISFYFIDLIGYWNFFQETRSADKLRNRCFTEIVTTIAESCWLLFMNLSNGLHLHSLQNTINTKVDHNQCKTFDNTLDRFVSKQKGLFCRKENL